jgi:hypothetical protein
MMAGSTGFVSMLFYVLFDVLPHAPDYRIAVRCRHIALYFSPGFLIAI